jgi:DNA repair protein RadC
MKEAIQIKNPYNILPLIHKWKNCRQENFLTITLNGAHEVIKVHHISKGLVNKTIVHPRESFYPAIKDLAVAFIFVHNHPSGNASPSSEDEEITSRLSMTAEILGINMLDHIIITPKDTFYSFRQEGKMPDRHKSYQLKEFAASLTRTYKYKKEQSNE